MILDKQAEFSAAQAVTASANATNVLDLGPVNAAGFSTGDDDLGEILFTIDTTFTAAGAATLRAQLVSADTADLATNPVVHAQSDDLPVASLTAGSRFAFKPDIAPDAKRYFGIKYVVGTGPFTAGAISARLATSRQTNK